MRLKKKNSLEEGNLRKNDENPLEEEKVNSELIKS